MVIKVKMQQDRSHASGHLQAANTQDFDQSRQEEMSWRERDALFFRGIAKQLHGAGFTVPQVRAYNRRAGIYLSAAIDLLELAADEIDKGAV